MKTPDISTYLCDKERQKTLFQIGNIFENEIILSEKLRIGQINQFQNRKFFNQNDLQSTLYHSKNDLFEII